MSQALAKNRLGWYNKKTACVTAEKAISNRIARFDSATAGKPVGNSLSRSRNLYLIEIEPQKETL